MASTITAGNATNGFLITSDNTGILQVKTGTGAGTTALTLDASQNVGIGTSSPVQRLEVSNTSTNTTFSTVGNQLLIRNSGSTANAFARIDFSGSTNTPMASIAAQLENYGTGATSIIFGNTNTGTGAITERARIDSSGNLLVGTTGAILATARATFSASNTAGVVSAVNNNVNLFCINTNNTSWDAISFRYNTSTEVGRIACTASATTYSTNSDYRLKENVQPMTGALAKVAQLKPCTYTWKADGSDGQGFIAHELAEVVPDAVTGEKDAVNEDGSIKPQGIDTSFLVATLTAAIQEQQKMIDELKAKVAALEGAPK